MKRGLILTVFVFGLFALFFIGGTITGFSIIEVEKYGFDDLPAVIVLEKDKISNFDIDHEEGVRFSDNTDLFDIDELSGEISFVPSEVGKFNVVIIALRDVGDFKYKLISFEVVE